MSAAALRPLTLLTLCGAALVVPAGGAADSGSQHDRQHELKNKLEATREQIASARSREQQLNDAISSQSGQIASLRGRIGTLAAELAGLEQQLAAARQRLGAARARLRDETERLALLRRQLTLARQHLEDRLVEIYTSDEPDLVSLLFGADSLDDLIDQLDLQSRVVEQDSQLVSEVENLRSEVGRVRARTSALEREQAAQTAALERRTTGRRAAYASLVSQRDRLASLQADRAEALASVRVERREWEAEAAALEAESQEVASLIAQASPPTPPSPSGGEGGGGHDHPSTGGGSSASGFIWPVQGTVVSPFGMRWGRLHAGIDIAAPAGTPVVASNSGRVIYAGWMSGYGLLVVIQHAGSIATAYAHNSSLAAGVGQTVGRGQRIAAVGCTGSCFGNHVHFEVRVGGTPVDPMRYL